MTLYPRRALQVQSYRMATAIAKLPRASWKGTPLVNTVLLHAVVDIYSAWCGPCKAVQGLFRRLKNELGDELLRFALV